VTRHEPRAVSPQHAALATGLSLCTIYRAIRAGELRAKKQRSRWLISVNELRRFVGDPVEVENVYPRVLKPLAMLSPRERAMVMEALGSPSRTRGQAHARG